MGIGTEVLREVTVIEPSLVGTDEVGGKAVAFGLALGGEVDSTEVRDATALRAVARDVPSVRWLRSQSISSDNGRFTVAYRLRIDFVIGL